MARRQQADLVIIRRRRLSHDHDDEPHGGTWKIAYADFVTAMMTFFLLMWLINVTTPDQKDALAEYFNPVALSRSNSGADGMLDGRAVGPDGALNSASAEHDGRTTVASPPVVASIGQDDRSPAGQRFESLNPLGGTSFDLLAPAGSSPGQPRDEFQTDTPPSEEDMARMVAEIEAQQAAAAREAADFARIADDLHNRILESASLHGLSENLVIEETPEGLRIQITDADNMSMFAVGSAEMSAKARELLHLVGEIAAGVPNPLSVAGHTDGRPFQRKGGYGNWELSSDRAQAARRALTDGGLPATRIIRVEGRADLEHMIADDPNDPRNRRISIMILRLAPPPVNLVAPSAQ